jgi:predicted nucleic acid-binding protein
MSGAEFVDTNIFVYAHDPDEATKYLPAKALIERLWVEVAGRISTQVLQELYSTITRKKPRLSPSAAFDLVEELSAWPIHSPTASDVLAAIRLSMKDSLSIWDAMIIQSAIASGCSILWSEDLKHGRRYGSVTVRNPFRRS